jgi:hypothetical protein
MPRSALIKGARLHERRVQLCLHYQSQSQSVLGLLNRKPTARLWQSRDIRLDRSRQSFCRANKERRKLQMSEIKSFPSRSKDSEMIVKLISAGYLQPQHRHNPDAIANAITRMKEDLRTGNGSDNPPAA